MPPTSSSAPAGRLAGGRLPSLDGLRALAILGVLVAHVASTPGFPAAPWLQKVADRGATGVDLFFVISGLLITTLMLREMSRTGRLDLKGFYLRRILRIVPAYACLLGVVWLLQRCGGTVLSAREWWAALTYTVNFVPYDQRAPEIGHAWSLSIEEHFYLVWPLLLALTGAAWGRRWAAACLVFCPLARLAIVLFFPDWCRYCDELTFTRLDGIAAGCLLALLAWDAQWRARLDALVLRGKVVPLLMLCLAASLTLSALSARFQVVVGTSANALCLGLLVWAAVRRPETVVGTVLNSWPAQIVGTGSYSLYLWQQLFLQRPGADFTCRFPQNLLFAVLAAFLSYVVIERPFLILKDRLSRSVPKPAQVLVEPAVTM